MPTIHCTDCRIVIAIMLLKLKSTNKSVWVICENDVEICCKLTDRVEFVVCGWCYCADIIIVFILVVYLSAWIAAAYTNAIFVRHDITNTWSLQQILRYGLRQSPNFTFCNTLSPLSKWMQMNFCWDNRMWAWQKVDLRVFPLSNSPVAASPHQQSRNSSNSSTIVDCLDQFVHLYWWTKWMRLWCLDC